jgi:carbon storage regulator CsrA
MLVITRREGEEVVIGDPQNPIGVVRIASIKGDRVRIAFDFPRHIDVHRREVAQQILGALEAVAEPQDDGPRPALANPAAARTIEIVVPAAAISH